MRTKLLPALGIAGLLAGCASSPSVPYWQNSRWINALATKIENQLVYPIEATKAGFPSGQAIVQFTYDNGRLTDVFIAKSTGNYILDSAITTQIAQIKPPILPGSEIAVPRQFRLPIALSIANSTFFRSLHNAIVHSATYYPESAMSHGQQGVVQVQFEYRNGNIFNAAVVRTIGEKVFEQAAIKKVTSAKVPITPDWALDKTFNFTIKICFTFRGNLCPGQNMEIRYVSSDMQAQVANNACTEVGFSYKNDKIVNVHITSSSGDANLDKKALQTISQGQFPQPSFSVRAHSSSFEIPVCYANKTPSQPSMKLPL